VQTQKFIMRKQSEPQKKYFNPSCSNKLLLFPGLLPVNIKKAIEKENQKY